MNFSSVQNQPTESSGNEKWGTNPPDNILHDIVQDLIRYLNGFQCLRETKKKIEEICGIKQDHNECWSVKDINRAWAESETFGKKSNDKKHWARLIMIQVLKRNFCYGCTGAVGQHGAASENQLSTFNESNDMEIETESPNEINSQTNYIRIPFSILSQNESTLSTDAGTNNSSSYKLIDGFPSRKDIRKRKSYVMSYDKQTENAEWVYEILNNSTLPKKEEKKTEGNQNYSKQMSFGKNNFKKNNSYHQGHLAAAANHKWCQEAYHDTYLMSNMAPQLMDLNNSMWKILEDNCRRMIDNDRVHNVHVYTGPLYLSKEKDLDSKYPVRNPRKMECLGEKNNTYKWKAVPTHFFKVVIEENKDGTVEKPKCYLMPNTKKEYDEEIGVKKDADIHSNEFIDKNCKTTIEYIQSHSELKFIENSPNVNMMDHIKTITWKGEDEKGESCNATIDIGISIPLDVTCSCGPTQRRHPSRAVRFARFLGPLSALFSRKRRREQVLLQPRLSRASCARRRND